MGVFQKICLEQPYRENKRNLKVFCTFKNTRDSNIVNSCKLSKIFKTTSKNLVRSSLLKLSRRATFRNIPTHVIEFLNVEMSPVAIPKGDSTSDSLPAISGHFWKTKKETFAVESLFSVITCDFTPDFYVIFYDMLFFTTQRKILRKIINCESLENSQENAYDGKYSTKVTNLQCTDYNSTISRLHHRFFSEYVPENSWLKVVVF